ncbi:hypothetical protein AALP_AA4G103300 [Arabis alpina]|uniref:DUF4283 domain-containing protein n=1 Tax=Arabis alpina TaxID=50452 RepID=A0A087H2D9_ARAAL|nr:hypothetical protein AALP_AA4G103300 [Arabis alpina]
MAKKKTPKKKKSPSKKKLARPSPPDILVSPAVATVLLSDVDSAERISGPQSPSTAILAPSTVIVATFVPVLAEATIALDLKIDDAVKVASATDLVSSIVTPKSPNVSTAVSASIEALKATGKDANLPVNDSWANMVKNMVKDTSQQLKKKGTSFTLPPGEPCVMIPNSVNEKNRKSWDCFVLGQFYSDPPSHGTIHNIVNGIWSKQFRDISVSKMEGHAFLFRIPNSFTRNRVINQRLWQIEGQTVFVAKWDPGVVPVKPELTSAPIWLELRNVPFQFFNEDGLEHIAGLVGTLNICILLQPTRRTLRWQRDIGHSLKHCRKAPISCKGCSSTSHDDAHCPKLRDGNAKKMRHIRRRRSKTPARSVDPTLTTDKGSIPTNQEWIPKKVHLLEPGPLATSHPNAMLILSSDVQLCKGKDVSKGESSGATKTSDVEDGDRVSSPAISDNPPCSEPLEDSEDTMSSGYEEDQYEEVMTRSQRKKLRGKCLKSSF